jgi:hypothetical protein
MPMLTHDPQSVSPSLADTLFQAGIDLTSVPGVRSDMLHVAIARYNGFCNWSVDHTGWVVTLYFPEERTFSGGTLEDGLMRCLTWLAHHSDGDRDPIASASSPGSLTPQRQTSSP